MVTQGEITLFGALLEVVLDLGSLVPGLNIPVGALRLVEDGIEVEEATYLLLQTPVAHPLRKSINKMAVAMGFHPIADTPAKTIRIVPANPTPKGYHWDVWQGWVLNTPMTH